MDNSAFLKSVNLFQDFDEEDLALFVAISRELVFSANDVVAYQRDVADRLFIVKSGRLAAVRTERDGHKTQVAQSFVNHRHFLLDHAKCRSGIALEDGGDSNMRRLTDR